MVRLQVTYRSLALPPKLMDILGMGEEKPMVHGARKQQPTAKNTGRHGIATRPCGSHVPSMASGWPGGMGWTGLVWLAARVCCGALWWVFVFGAVPCSEQWAALRPGPRHETPRDGRAVRSTVYADSSVQREGLFCLGSES